MNHKSILLIAFTLMFFACGEAPQSSGSSRIVAKDASAKKLKESDDVKTKEKEKKEKEKDDEEDEEEEIDQEDDDDAKSKKLDKAKEDKEDKEEKDKQEKELAKKLTPMTLTTKHSEDDGLILKVKTSEGKWSSIPLAAEGASSKSDAICGEKEVVLEIQIEHPGKGTMSPGTSHLGLRSKLKDSVEIGYEVDGNCHGTACQDDNIIVLSCPNGISVKGM
jgi:hypothetical protein